MQLDELCAELVKSAVDMLPGNNRQVVDYANLILAQAQEDMLSVIGALKFEEGASATIICGPPGRLTASCNGGNAAFLAYVLEYYVTHVVVPTRAALDAAIAAPNVAQAEETPAPEYVLPDGFTACARGEVPTDLMAGDMIFVWDDQAPNGDRCAPVPNGRHRVAAALDKGGLIYSVQGLAPGPFLHGIVGYRRVASAPQPFKFGDKLRVKVSGQTVVCVTDEKDGQVRVAWKSGLISVVDARPLERLPNA